MIAYKLMRLRKDGTLGSLFINRKEIYPEDKWLVAENYPTKGYAPRYGWHCCLKPEAPHLKLKSDRTWVKVEVEEIEFYDRPESQGGMWILAKYMKILKILD